MSPAVKFPSFNPARWVALGNRSRNRRLPEDQNLAATWAVVEGTTATARAGVQVAGELAVVGWVGAP
ncbi:hypothetical protein GCM10009657_15940 [Oryzihumus leptocrescens]